MDKESWYTDLKILWKNSIAKHSWFRKSELLLKDIVFEFVYYDTKFLSLCIVRILEKIFVGESNRFNLSFYV